MIIGTSCTLPGIFGIFLPLLAFLEPTCTEFLQNLEVYGEFLLIITWKLSLHSLGTLRCHCEAQTDIPLARGYYCLHHSQNALNFFLKCSEFCIRQILLFAHPFFCWAKSAKKVMLWSSHLTTCWQSHSNFKFFISCRCQIHCILMSTFEMLIPIYVCSVQCDRW